MVGFLKRLSFFVVLPVLCWYELLAWLFIGREIGADNSPAARFSDWVDR